eukprot:9223674-Pyramimonas_sp.AAC.1
MEYFLLEGTLPLPKNKQISEEEFRGLYPRHDRAEGREDPGLEHEELTYEGILGQAQPSLGDAPVQTGSPFSNIPGAS